MWNPSKRDPNFSKPPKVNEKSYLPMAILIVADHSSGMWNPILSMILIVPDHLK
jgi:hypothetical protein